MKAGAFHAPQRRAVKPGDRVTAPTSATDHSKDRAMLLSSATRSSPSKSNTARSRSVGAEARGGPRDDDGPMARATTLGLKRASMFSSSFVSDRVDIRSPSPTRSLYNTPPRPPSTDSRPRALPTTRPRPPPPSQTPPPPPGARHSPEFRPVPPPPSSTTASRAPTRAVSGDPVKSAAQPQTSRSSTLPGPAAAPNVLTAQSTPVVPPSAVDMSTDVKSLFGSFWARTTQVLSGAASEDDVRVSSIEPPAAATKITPFVITSAIQNRVESQEKEAAIAAKPGASRSALPASTTAAKVERSKSDPTRPIVPARPTVEPITWHRPPAIHPRDMVQRAPIPRGSDRTPFDWLAPCDCSPLDPFLFHRAANRAATRLGRTPRPPIRPSRIYPDPPPVPSFQCPPPQNPSVQQRPQVVHMQSYNLQDGNSPSSFSVGAPGATLHFTGPGEPQALEAREFTTNAHNQESLHFASQGQQMPLQVMASIQTLSEQAQAPWNGQSPAIQQNHQPHQEAAQVHHGHAYAQPQQGPPRATAAHIDQTQTQNLTLPSAAFGPRVPPPASSAHQQQIFPTPLLEHSPLHAPLPSRPAFHVAPAAPLLVPPPPSQPPSATTTALSPSTIAFYTSEVQAAYQLPTHASHGSTRGTVPAPNRASNGFPTMAPQVASAEFAPPFGASVSPERYGKLVPPSSEAVSNITLAPVLGAPPPGHLTALPVGSSTPGPSPPPPTATPLYPVSNLPETSLRCSPFPSQNNLRRPEVEGLETFHSTSCSPTLDASATSPVTPATRPVPSSFPGPLPTQAAPAEVTGEIVSVASILAPAQTFPPADSAVTSIPSSLVLPTESTYARDDSLSLVVPDGSQETAQFFITPPTPSSLAPNLPVGEIAVARPIDGYLREPLPDDEGDEGKDEETKEEEEDAAPPQLNIPLLHDLGWTLPDLGFGSGGDDKSSSDFFSSLGGPLPAGHLNAQDDGSSPSHQRSDSHSLDFCLNTLERESGGKEDDVVDLSDAFDARTEFARKEAEPLTSAKDVNHGTRMEKWLVEQGVKPLPVEQFNALPLGNAESELEDAGSLGSKLELLDPEILGPPPHRAHLVPPSTIPLSSTSNPSSAAASCTLSSLAPLSPIFARPHGPTQISRLKLSSVGSIRARNAHLRSIALPLVDDAPRVADGQPSPTTAEVESASIISRPRSVSTVEQSIVYGGRTETLDDEREAAMVSPTTLAPPSLRLRAASASSALPALSPFVDSSRPKDRALAALSNDTFTVKSITPTTAASETATELATKSSLDDLFAGW